MRLSDTISGLLTLIVGLAVVAYASSFPTMPGQSVGPSLFPTLVGGAMALFGAALLFSGAQRRGTPLIAFDDWVRRPRMVFNFAVVVADVIFYALAVEWLGFFITAIIFLSVLFFAFGVRPTRIVPLAAAVTFALHYGFYTLLRVPLPWGLLGGIAW
jgi:putative tricarboxylic transport membrane protein